MKVFLAISITIGVISAVVGLAFLLGWVIVNDNDWSVNIFFGLLFIAVGMMLIKGIVNMTLDILKYLK